MIRLLLLICLYEYELASNDTQIANDFADFSPLNLGSLGCRAS